MTNPLTTPSGVPETTPIPRNPDGSPLPKKLMREVLAKRRRTAQDYEAAADHYEQEFSEEEAAAWMERHPQVVNADLSQAVEVEVQEPKWVSDDEAEKIRADIATATDNQVITSDLSHITPLAEEFVPAAEAIEKQQAEEPELTPQQKRAATLAKKKAAKEAEQNG